jgi:predicted metal-dependent peptidase
MTKPPSESRKVSTDVHNRRKNAEYSRITGHIPKTLHAKLRAALAYRDITWDAWLEEIARSEISRFRDCVKNEEDEG